VPEDEPTPWVSPIVAVPKKTEECVFVLTLEFFGQIFSADGTRPDPQRVVDLQNVATPTTVQEVRSLLGMANYSSQYIPNFATITAPLRLLTKNDTPFVWTTVHKNAFDNLKAALTSAPCMAYFDIHKETFVVVDASPVGVSAILSQKSPNVANSKVIAYASRALSPVETRYSQTEREALAIVWAVEHFHMFLFGHHFTLVTDHKPLEIIYGTTRSKPSARIERWVLRLQPYHFNVIYKPGATNPVDYISRHPASPRMSHPDRMAEEYVNFIERHTAPRAMPLDEIATATRADKTLSTLVTCLRTNTWSTDILTSFKHIKDELTVTNNGIILRGHRIVIPQALQQRAIDIAHKTHLGLTKTKALIREKIWFPNIDAMVKTTLDRCLTCQALGRPGPPAPITPHHHA
jgi:hypothetical protein